MEAVLPEGGVIPASSADAPAPNSVTQSAAPIALDALVYPKEKPLFAILAVIAALLWLTLIVLTKGLALLFVLLFFIAYLFGHSAFISYLKGTAVEITADQFPELHARFLESCKRLEIKTPPRAYLFAADGMLNALATRFLRRNYVVLFSSIVDALKQDPDGINFYMGHELGHIRRGHLGSGPFLVLSSWLPLLGPAYARACEYSCDLHGLRCTNSLESASRAVAVLAAGSEQWRNMNLDAYIRQSEESRGFWMSFHELGASYPWLTKRMGHLKARAEGKPYVAPGRSVLAWCLSLLMPRTGNPLGAMIFFFMILGVVAALLLPKMSGMTDKLPGLLGGGLSQDSSQWDQSYNDQSYTDQSYVDQSGANADAQGTTGVFAEDSSVADSSGEVAFDAGNPQQSAADIAAQLGGFKPIQDLITTHYQTTQAWPESVDVPEGLPVIQLYEQGIIGFTGSAALGSFQGYEIYLIPEVREAGIEWVCHSPDIPNEYLPEQCQG